MLDWNKHALDALANAQVPPGGRRGAGQMPAYVQGVHLAMVQGAVYDAVISIVGGYEPYLDSFRRHRRALRSPRRSPRQHATR